MTWGGGAIRRVDVELPVEGLGTARTVDFISDIHIRDQQALDEFRSAVSDSTADLLLLGGDYCEERRFLLPLFEHLASIWRVIFAVRGNNDHIYAGRLAALEHRLGVRFLEDEIVALDGLTLLGTRDPAKDVPRLPPLPLAPLLVLSHSPDILLDLPEDAPASVLAGHVHGGQIRVPGSPLWWSHTRVGRRFGEGRATRGRTELFVGRGIGCSLVDIRNVPREFYSVRLTPA